MLMRKNRKELQEKISEANRRRKIVIVGLIVGLVFIILGQLAQFPIFLIIGLTIFPICTGITSFLTILKWLYAKALKKEMEEKAKPPPVTVCPRCGTKVRKNTKYCPRCGKKTQTKKR